MTKPSGGGGGSGGGSGTGTVGGGNGGSGGGNVSGCTPSSDPNADQDGDGYTVGQGDCNDCDPSINPGAVEVPGDGVDNDCNGMVDEKPTACDPAIGATDAPSIAQSIELCDKRFLVSAAMSSGTKNNTTEGRAVQANLGVITPHANSNFTMISTGKVGTTVSPQTGTDQSDSNTAPNPLPNLVGSSSCQDGSDNSTVNDYTEIDLQIKAPTNANSFSFDFNFLSAEYPEFVCQGFNDEFLVIVQSTTTYPTATNISFDSMKNPITINSGFFSVCASGCKNDDSGIKNTGFEGTIGGGTGWLTTTAPIAPGETFTLKFVIFDESDHIYDSAAVIDNFVWGTTKIMGPVTGPITKVIKHHHTSTPSAESLMCMPA